MAHGFKDQPTSPIKLLSSVSSELVSYPRVGRCLVSVAKPAAVPSDLNTLPCPLPTAQCPEYGTGATFVTLGDADVAPLSGEAGKLTSNARCPDTLPCCRRWRCLASCNWKYPIRFSVSCFVSSFLYVISPHLAPQGHRPVRSVDGSSAPSAPANPSPLYPCTTKHPPSFCPAHSPNPFPSCFTEAFERADPNPRDEGVLEVEPPASRVSRGGRATRLFGLDFREGGGTQ